LPQFQADYLAFFLHSRFPVTANELKLDYFHIYDVGNQSAAGDVLLRGQFDVRR